MKYVMTRDDAERLANGIHDGLAPFDEAEILGYQPASPFENSLEMTMKTEALLRRRILATLADTPDPLIVVLARYDEEIECIEWYRDEGRIFAVKG